MPRLPGGAPAEPSKAPGLLLLPNLRQSLLDVSGCSKDQGRRCLNCSSRDTRKNGELTCRNKRCKRKWVGRAITREMRSGSVIVQIAGRLEASAAWQHHLHYPPSVLPGLCAELTARLRELKKTSRSRHAGILGRCFFFGQPGFDHSLHL